VQWMANLLADARSVHLSEKGGTRSWAVSGCQIRMIEGDIFIGGLIEGLPKSDDGYYIEVYLKDSKVDLISMEIDILEDKGLRYLNASSVSGETKVLYMTNADNKKPRVTIERTIKNNDKSSALRE